MKDESDRNLKCIFDKIAENYNLIRPGYPLQLIEDIIRLSRIKPSGKIFEIGCGTGQATVSFAERNYEMTCIDIGRNLCELAKAKFKSYPNVKIVNVALEEYHTIDNYDLVICAQAFHWIDPQTGYEKIYQLLNKNGVMALFWNESPDSKDKVMIELSELLSSASPLLKKDIRPDYKTKILNQQKELRNSRLFKNIVVKKYPWKKKYTADEYVQLFNSFSDYNSLEPELRKSLDIKIKRLIEESGNFIIKPYVAVLYFGVKTGY